jgi:hypothetical protein
MNAPAEQRRAERRPLDRICSWTRFSRSQQEPRLLASVPGGRTVALEFVLNEDRALPGFSAMFAFQMLGSTPQGDGCTNRDF